MKLTFGGAAQTVTGSRHLLSVDGKQYLLDCGLYQGRRQEAEARNRSFPFDVKRLDAVVLSHAHIDHSGTLPLLVKRGFHGPIYATPATVDLCNWMLQDTAHIQESDAEFVNRRRRKKGLNEPPVQPLYSMSDAQNTIPLFRAVPYHTPTPLHEGLTYESYDAGHMLGSSAVLLSHAAVAPVRLLFSGDVGRRGLPIIRDPEPAPPADYLILESTYGGRFHKPLGKVADKLADVVSRTVARGGRIIVPAFAVGRVQQLVVLLHQLANEGRIPGLPIFVDSPLALNVTEVHRRHPECFDEETREYLKEGGDPFGFKRLQYIREAADSKRLNTLPGSFMVISASGMCESGRILHHLRNNIEEARNTVLITGYQAEHTLGRRLVEKQTQVNIFGEPMTVRAEIASLDELSGHADHAELLEWIDPVAPHLRKIFLVHGEPEAAAALGEAITARYRVEVIAPSPGQSFPLV